MICAAVSVIFFTGWRRGMEMVMCDAVSVMVCYREGKG